MMKTMFKMTMALGLMALAASQVAAQANRNCAPRQMVLERLAERYGETRQSIGLGANNAVIEVFASTDTGTWTITVTTPEGLTCLVASGQSFEALAEVLPPRGNDACGRRSGKNKKPGGTGKWCGRSDDLEKLCVWNQYCRTRFSVLFQHLHGKSRFVNKTGAGLCRSAEHLRGGAFGSRHRANSQDRRYIPWPDPRLH
jgi:hypothetical protein